MNCPCGSGLPYRTCCAALHNGKAASTPLELMRARYSAYALGKIDFIIRTTHPLNAQYKSNKKVWREALKDWCRHTQFNGLEIVETKDGKTLDEGYVIFRAFLCINQTPYTQYEKSYFLRVKGNWLYRDGIREEEGWERRDKRRV